MIIRSLRLRHSRIAFPRPSTPVSTLRRALTTDVEKSRINNPFENAQSEVDISGASPPVNASGTRVQIQDPDDPVAQRVMFTHHQKTTTAHLGRAAIADTTLDEASQFADLAVAPHYKPHELLTNPPSPKDITLELLMASQSHLGHATSLWHPANAKYIFGIRGADDPIHIISLDVTAAYLRRACKIVRGVTERGGLVLFVGTRNGQARAVVKAAELAKGCHLFTKWTPGTITNGQQILGKCQKKVVNELDEEVEGFDEQLIEASALKPDLVVCFNPTENYILLHECGLNNIPTIGVVDTNCNPTWVTYPIPANDDSHRCIQVIAGVLGRAGEEGQVSRLAQAKEGITTYRYPHGLGPPDDDAVAKKREQREMEAQMEMFDEDVDLDEISNASLLMDIPATPQQTSPGLEIAEGPVEVEATAEPSVTHHVDTSHINDSSTNPKDTTASPNARDDLPQNSEHQETKAPSPADDVQIELSSQSDPPTTPPNRSLHSLSKEELIELLSRGGGSPMESEGSNGSESKHTPQGKESSKGDKESEQESKSTLADR